MEHEAGGRVGGFVTLIGDLDLRKPTGSRGGRVQFLQ